jgi:hypothetical protein
VIHFDILKQSIFLLLEILPNKMKTELEIAEYRKVIEERLVKTKIHGCHEILSRST